MNASEYDLDARTVVLSGPMKYYPIAINPKWGAVTYEEWGKACAYPGGGIRDEKLRGILPELYSHFPHPGRPFQKEMPVFLQHGEIIAEHSHPEWTLIYYVYPGNPPVPLIVGDDTVWTSKNMAIMLPPNTAHSVPVSSSRQPRLSIALRWIAEG